MKKLFIVRHAKATHRFMPDKERFIIEKGIKRTKKFAKQLRELSVNPDLILSSTAKRAKQTAEIIAEIFEYSKNKIVEKEVFYFKPDKLVFNEIFSIDNKYNTVFIVGHNPIWTDIADYYSNQEIFHLRTSGIFGVMFDTDKWLDIELVDRNDIILIN